MIVLGHTLGSVLGIALMAACVVDGRAAGLPRPIRAATAGITSEGLLRHTRMLASDEFEGRAPASPGEEKTLRYLVDQFKALGLKPGNPDGTYVQNVGLVGLSGQAEASYQIGGKRTELTQGTDSVVWSRRYVPEVSVQDSDVVFVGYGVVAPEYGWDDYKGVDVRGKTIVMLVNDPAVPDPQEPDRLDPKMFKGRAMTYYGRWTYKFEIATEKGAAAAIIVHETEPAGYPWAVVVASNSRENFDLQRADKNAGRVAVEGWITRERAQKLVAAGGYDFEALKRAAVSRDFKPVSLGSRASFSIRHTLREVSSRNVVAKLEGSGPVLRDQYVIFNAHWDHLGRDPQLSGDQIYNGALDNASGVAGVLELAAAFRHLSRPPKRSILFMSVTAEEKGLLGAKYYAEHPLYPLNRTVAILNMDGLNPWGRTRDVQVIGYGSTTMEALLATAAAAQGRRIVPEAEPEKGGFYRSDHFEFAKLGVPGLYPAAGIDYVGRPSEFGRQKIAEYLANDYHKVTDEVKPGWDFAGAQDDVRLLFHVGWLVAQDRKWPLWLPGTEFKVRREQSLR